MNKVIVVDLDGTLIDSSHRSYHLFRHLTGTAMTIDEYRELKRNGNSNQQILTKFGWSPELIQDFSMKWNAGIETSEWLQYDLLFPFAIPALSRLRQYKYELWLVTARRNETALHDQLVHFDIKKYFEKVIVSSSILSKLMAVSNHRESECIEYVIGDTEEEIFLAKELGSYSVSVASGARSHDFLKTAGAQQITNSIDDFASSLPL